MLQFEFESEYYNRLGKTRSDNEHGCAFLCSLVLFTSVLVCDLTRSPISRVINLSNRIKRSSARRNVVMYYKNNGQKVLVDYIIMKTNENVVVRVAA